jgi:hypothetical protein
VTGRPVLALLAALLVAAAPLGAQDNPALRDAVRLAGEGRGDDARRIVAAELSRATPGDAVYIEALYWRARLTAVGDSAERDLRRIAIEFPTSRWAPAALLQLAQLAMAAGNPASAYALAGRLRSDYPDGDLRSQAAFWAGRAAFDIGQTRAACALLDSALTEGAADVEFVNRVSFYRSRCTAPARADTAPPTPATPPPAAAPAGRFAVQVAAVRTAREEQRVLNTLRAAGFEGRAFAGSDGFRRVRVVGYATEVEALAAARQLRPVVGGRPFVVRQP